MTPLRVPWIFFLSMLSLLTVTKNRSADQGSTQPVYEYASVRFDGDSTSITWPDGKVEKVLTLIGKKSAESADTRIWFLTVAINVMSEKGFVLAFLDNRDVLMKRINSTPAHDYAGVRFTGSSTSIVWPDGTVEKVTAPNGQRGPESADIRMWYVTVAMNLMGKKGFQPIRLDRDPFWKMDMVDVWMERSK